MRRRYQFAAPFVVTAALSPACKKDEPKGDKPASSSASSSVIAEGGPPCRTDATRKVDTNGKLVTSWRLPAKTTLVAVGQGVVYTVRTDEDDLRYLQRVEIGK